MITSTRRLVFVREDDRVDDYLINIIRNDGDSEVSVPPLVFKYTDAVDLELIWVRQNADWAAAAVPERKDANLEVYVPPRPEVLPPGGGMLTAVHVRRGGLVRRLSDVTFFSDPLLAYDEGLVGEDHETVLFPRPPVPTEVIAERAITTSRTATWRREGRGATPCQAMLRTSKLGVGAGPLDDFIAGLHVLLASVVAGLAPDSEDARAALSQMPPAAGDSFAMPDDAEFHAWSWADRISWIDQTLAAALASRRRASADPMTITSSDAAHAMAQRFAIHLSQFDLPDATIPGRFWSAALALSSFHAEHRARPLTWVRPVAEAHFAERLELFLRGRSRLEREVATAQGWLDLMVDGTPVELKCRAMTAKTSLAKEAQQAAEYATSRCYRVGFLMILDTADPSTKHRPYPIAETTVVCVPAAPAVGGALPTYVAVLVVPAFQQQPSRLSGR